MAKCSSFSFSISPSNEYSRLISFRMDWLDLLAVQGIKKITIIKFRKLFTLVTLLLLLLSRFSRVRLCATSERQPTRLRHPWDSPGKNTGVGCHFLLQCMKVKCESEVAQSCLTPSDPMDCSPPGSSVHGILQARVLEWGAIAFSISHISHLN